MMDTSEFLQIVKDGRYRISTNEQWAAHVHYMINRPDLKRAIKELFGGFKPLEDLFKTDVRLSTMPQYANLFESLHKQDKITYATYCREIQMLKREITNNGISLDETSMYLSRDAHLFIAKITYQRHPEDGFCYGLYDYSTWILDTPQKIETVFAQYAESSKYDPVHLGESIERVLIYFANGAWKEKLRSAELCRSLRESLQADYNFVGSRTEVEID